MRTGTWDEFLKICRSGTRQSSVASLSTPTRSASEGEILPGVFAPKRPPGRHVPESLRMAWCRLANPAESVSQTRQNGGRARPPPPLLGEGRDEGDRQSQRNVY